MYNISALVINSQQSITEVQRKFNDLFPFLKIEFFHPLSNNKIRKEKFTASDMKVIDIPNAKKFNNMIFEGSMTVNQIENICLSECGLIIQIFRKSGPIWLETNATNKWTLDRQNLEGKILEEYLRKKS